MNTNIPIAAAFTLLIALFIYSCTSSLPSKLDEREIRDYPTGKNYENNNTERNLSSEQQ